MSKDRDKATLVEVRTRTQALIDRVWRTYNSVDRVVGYNKLMRKEVVEVTNWHFLAVVLGLIEGLKDSYPINEVPNDLIVEAYEVIEATAEANMKLLKFLQHNAEISKK